MAATVTARADASPYFTEPLFAFLEELRAHNDRAWFQANKARYEAVLRDPCLRFIADFEPRLKRLSPLLVADPRPSGGSLFRIYRDTRFSRDKSPYKTHAAMHFPHRDGDRHESAPGFYLHLEPGHCFAAAGLWHPEGDALRRVRDAIVAHPRAWKAARGRLRLEGELLKRPPQGYDSTHPLIEDLKRKDFVTSMPFRDSQVSSPRFLSDFARTCRAMSPLVAFLSEAVGLPW